MLVLNSESLMEHQPMWQAIWFLKGQKVQNIRKHSFSSTQ
ncbi:hypothetical protein JCM19238_3443 [Vibrio ponticus]|nr:hypothetical protein JCM19238_3443 [Vibrio ponticus]